MFIRKLKYEKTKKSEAMLDYLVLLRIYSENSCLDFYHRMFCLQGYDESNYICILLNPM